MKKENVPIGFELQGIKTEQYAVFEKNYDSKKEAQLGTDIQFKIDQQNRQIGVFVGLEFSQVKKVFLKIVVSCHFKIREDSWTAFIIASKVTVPKDFLAHLTMITTGTARGVLFAKSESTVFSKFMVPILNVAEMITEDAVFDLPVDK